MGDRHSILLRGEFSSDVLYVWMHFRRTIKLAYGLNNFEGVFDMSFVDCER